jgi:hypothetical protein
VTNLTESEYAQWNKWIKEGFLLGLEAAKKREGLAGNPNTSPPDCPRCREERERVKDLVEAATGLSYGTDWNNGTHAKLHGYRQKLLDALKAYKEGK